MSSVQRPTNTFLLLKGSSGLCSADGGPQLRLREPQLSGLLLAALLQPLYQQPLRLAGLRVRLRGEPIAGGRGPLLGVP